jgi:formylglycine-generating enzyme required for sulfatase activity
MILIPGSVFQMGATANSLAEECALFREGCQNDWFSASEPVHTVLLDSYYFDAHEVTNAAYVEFLNQSGDLACQEQPCLDPEHTEVVLEDDAYLVPDELAQHPAAGITWFGATAFCEWREARLPTEAEWEKAAAWDDEGSSARRYPWGDDFDGQIVNFCDAACQEPQANVEFNDGFAESAPVASFEEGRSAAGAYDMAGNVWEWVADWYDPDYYQVSTEANPIGPADGEEKVVRGGSWFDTGNFSASAIRFPSGPENADRTIGFRCAANIP